MRRKRVAVFIAAGSLCLAAALGLTAFNIWDDQRAAVSAQTGVAELEAVLADTSPAQWLLIPEPQVMMTSVQVEEQDYIGILEIPALGLSLPIQGEWSEHLLKTSPCLYEGDLYQGMIIAGHNYRSHFGGLPRVYAGDEVIFRDVDGNVWHYTVCITEVIDGSDTEAMSSGNWDLTLFTCTYGGKERFTLRCNLAL